MAVERNTSAPLASQREAHGRGSLGLPDLVVGPPVNWNLCLRCGKEMRSEEERFRVEVQGQNGRVVGIGHNDCEGFNVR